MTFFIDYKNELLLFRIMHISVYLQRATKLSIIMILGIIQWILFLLIENDKHL